jgi:hypothetical protein
MGFPEASFLYVIFSEKAVFSGRRTLGGVGVPSIGP